MTARRRDALAGLLLLGMSGSAVEAADPPTTVIYRCTNAQGAVALQDEPCAAGQREERREFAALTPAPPPAPESTPDALPKAEASTPLPSPEPRIEFAVVEPPRQARLFTPPPLWRCTDLNGQSRLADAYDPNPRCVPLSVLGVDLSRAPPSAATLCRTVEDPCIELSGDAACAAWQERLDAAESALRTAFSDAQAQRRRERDRARDVLKADCAP